MPMIQLFVLSYAVTTDLKHVRLAVFDEDRTARSRELISAFYSSDLFLRGPSADSPSELHALLEKSETDMTVWIPKGYAEKLEGLGGAQVAITVDGQNSSSAGRALGYSEALLRQESQRILQQRSDANPALALKARRIEPVTRFYYNPELQSRYYMIPGIVVLLLTVVSAMLTGMAIVKEKEIGTLEQLMVTPLSPGEIIAGKLIPFAVLAYAELLVATTVAVLWFKLPLVGSIALLAFCSLCYLLVTLSSGLLASTVSHTQQQAMLTVWFGLVFCILTSGFFYPIENMPKWIQVLTYVNPMRYFMAILRGLFLKGSTLVDVMPNLIPLVSMGAVVFVIAVIRFRHKNA